MTLRPKPFQPIKMLQIIGGVFFAYLFFGFMLLPCLNTLTSIFTVKNAAGETDPLAVIRFFLAGSMSQYVWNSLQAGAVPCHHGQRRRHFHRAADRVL